MIQKSNDALVLIFISGGGLVTTSSSFSTLTAFNMSVLHERFFDDLCVSSHTHTPTLTHHHHPPSHSLGFT